MKITYKSGSETNGVKRLVVDVTRRRFFGLGPAVTETVEYVRPKSSIEDGINVEWFELSGWKKTDNLTWVELEGLWLYHKTIKGEKP